MSVWKDARTAAEHREPDRVPVVLFNYGLVLKRYFAVSEYEYYQNVRLQLEAKVAFQRRFPGVLSLHMFPEFGGHMGPIPTAFGAKLEWMRDSPPWVTNYPIKKPEDVDKLTEQGVPNPNEVGVTKELLQRYEYFYEWYPKDLREEYGYIHGWIYPGMCIEGAALAMGYDTFLIWLYRNPEAVHKWLRLATDFMLRYCEALEEKVGKCRVLVVADHTASMVGKELFQEFILPYLNKVLGRYKGALRVWHNEGSVGHMLEEVDKIDAEVWQFGYLDAPAQCKAKTHFCLMGNIHPPLFAKFSPSEVEKECKKIIMEAGEGGGLWLSTGGGLDPTTPLKNIEAMIKAAEKYGKYPLKGKLQNSKA